MKWNGKGKLSGRDFLKSSKLTGKMYVSQDADILHGENNSQLMEYILKKKKDSLLAAILIFFL